MYLGSRVRGRDRLRGNRSRKGVFQIFKHKEPKSKHHVNNMLDGLLNSGAAQERLSDRSEVS